MAETTEKQIVRIMNVDIAGNKPVLNALTKIKGISYSFSDSVCNVLGLEKTKNLGLLSNEEIKKIEETIRKPAEHNLPVFLMNRRKDRDSGENKHITGTDIKFVRDFDIKRFTTIKSYKGIRHALGLPVRGQSTEHHFRHGKTIGVKKKGIIAAAAPEKGKK